MAERTCTIDGCDGKHRARGLCSTHYNEAHQPNRHAKVAVACGHCGAPTLKHSTTRFAERFCSLICRDLWRIESGVNPHPPIQPAKPKPIKLKVDQRSPLRRALEDGDGDAVIAAIKADCDIRPSGCWEWRRKLHASGYAVVSIAGKTHQVHRLTLEARLGAPLGKQAAHHACANTFCVNPDHLQPVTAAANIAEMLARRYMETRIADLESALRAVDPHHPLLHEIGVAKTA